MSHEKRYPAQTSRKQVPRQSHNQDDGQADPDGPAHSDVQKILKWTNEVDTKLETLSARLEIAVTSLQHKPAPEQGSLEASKSTSSTLIPLTEIAPAYDKQVERLKLENKKLHGHIQESLKSKDRFRDDELGQKFETLKRQIEQVCRSNCRFPDKRPGLEWKPMARLADKIHEVIFRRPKFALENSDYETTLVDFEENLFNRLGDNPAISEWRSATIHIAEASGLTRSVDLPSTADSTAEELKDLVDFVDERKFKSALGDLFKRAYELNMILRKSTQMYAWDQRGRLRLPDVNWTEYPNYLDHDSNGQYQERILFGPLVKRINGNWSVVQNGYRLVARKE